MSDDKKITAEEDATDTIYEMIDKVLPRSILLTFKRFTGINIDSWGIAEKIMKVSQKYVERKIEESK